MPTPADRTGRARVSRGWRETVMGTTEPIHADPDQQDREYQTAWAYRRAADAVSDRQARIAATERQLEHARRQLAAAERDLMDARLAADLP